MTSPSRLAFIASIAQITALVETEPGLCIHQTVAYAKMFVFTFEELGVELFANTISVYMSNLLGLLETGRTQRGTDAFPWSLTKHKSPLGRWKWAGHGLMQLAHNETTAIRPVHFVGLHAGPEEADGDSVMKFTYR